MTKKHFTNIKKTIILQPSSCLICANAWLTDKTLHRDLIKWQRGVNAVFCLEIPCCFSLKTLLM